MTDQTPAKSEDEIFRAALAPERRYQAITLGVPRNAYPGDLGLFFESMHGNGTNIVNLRPGDMPVLRAAVIPEDPDLDTIRELATAALGPGARKYVHQAHVQGYRTGVRDMEAVHTTMGAAEWVDDYLAGLQDEDLPDVVLDAIETLRTFLGSRMKDAADHA
jgi:hypothetical protein